MLALLFVSGLLTGTATTALMLGFANEIGILYFPAAVALMGGVILSERYNG